MLIDERALLFATLVGIAPDDAHEILGCCVLIGPLETEVSVEIFPRDFTDALASAATSDLRRCAQALDEEHFETWGSHSPGGAKELVAILQELQALARSCTPPKELFVLSAP